MSAFDIACAMFPRERGIAVNDESFAWDSADERAICKQHNERLLSPTGETLDEFLASCFAVYQAQPLAVATPVVLVGQKVVEGWKR